ncbi:MAG TPA: hypothetical protein VFK65_03245 [Candidatus Binatia bacterium]|nr:hypothetical protein [Candidatus Binatia bacterium]
MMTEKYAVAKNLDEIVGGNQQEKQRGDDRNPELFTGANPKKCQSFVNQTATPVRNSPVKSPGVTRVAYHRRRSVSSSDGGTHNHRCAGLPVVAATFELQLQKPNRHESANYPNNLKAVNFHRPDLKDCRIMDVPNH